MRLCYLLVIQLSLFVTVYFQFWDLYILVDFIFFEYMKHDCVYMSQSCLKYTPRKEYNSSSSILSHSHFFRSYPFAPSTQFYLFSSDYLYTFIFFNDFSILFSPITLYYLVYQEVPTPTAFSPL